MVILFLEDTGKSNVSEVSELSQEGRLAEAEKLYAELVEEYGADYESCGESIRVKADTCSAEDVEGGAPRKILILS